LVQKWHEAVEFARTLERELIEMTKERNGYRNSYDGASESCRMFKQQRDSATCDAARWKSKLEEEMERVTPAKACNFDTCPHIADMENEIRVLKHDNRGLRGNLRRMIRAGEDDLRNNPLNPFWTVLQSAKSAVGIGSEESDRSEDVEHSPDVFNATPTW